MDHHASAKPNYREDEVCHGKANYSADILACVSTLTIPGFTAGSSQIFWTAGKRVFNVSINGTQVLTNFDTFATAGAMNKAVVEQFTATANSSGQISLVFTTVTDKALISGIEIQ